MGLRRFTGSTPPFDQKEQIESNDAVEPRPLNVVIALALRVPGVERSKQSSS